jgi:hypothetical protein
MISIVYRFNNFQVRRLRVAQKSKAVPLLKEFVNGDDGYTADVADANHRNPQIPFLNVPNPGHHRIRSSEG